MWVDTRGFLTEDCYDFTHFCPADRWTQRQENETVEVVQGRERKSIQYYTHEGVKNMFIYRRAKPALDYRIRNGTNTRTLPPTGTSITLTRALVLRSPTIKSTTIKAKKRTISTATDAGKPTELKPISESTPKHARRISRIPLGTYSHAVRFRSHARWVTCGGLSASPRERGPSLVKIPIAETLFHPK
jgi:hypothetical protein